MPLHFRLADLPERFHKQVEAQISPRHKKQPHSPTTSSQTPPAKQNTPKLLGSPSPIPPPTKIPSPQDLQTKTTTSFKAPLPSNLRASKMTKPEIAFNRDFLDNHGLFEGITLKLPGGSNYTPDFVCILDNTPTLVECKGSYRLQSEGRAHTAFFEAAANYSWLFSFVWAVYNKDHSWTIKHVVPKMPNIYNNDTSCICTGIIRDRGIVKGERE